MTPLSLPARVPTTSLTSTQRCIAKHLANDPEPAERTPAPASAVYEVRSLRTDAERDEAAALVDERHRWLVRRGLPNQSTADVMAVFRDPHVRSAALFDGDGRLLACLVPRLARAAQGSRAGDCLYLGHVHTLPGQPGEIARVLSLWAADLAARIDVPFVRADVRVARPAGDRLLQHLADMGWEEHGRGPRPTDELGRLRLPAVRRPALAVFVDCQIVPAGSASVPSEVSRDA
ncbi:hypothetical protein ACWCXC_08605 [Streptomyces sp. NPDC001515]